VNANTALGSSKLFSEVHPLLSVTVTKYIPPMRLPISSLSERKLPLEFSHSKVYGAVPPVTVISICPSAPFVAEGVTNADATLIGADGPNTGIVDPDILPIASVTTTVYVPASRLLIS